jgi:aminomethyltransferase
MQSKFLKNTFQSVRGFASASSRVTALHKYHSERLGGKMVEFAGYDMPVLYAGEKGGVLKEHIHCRE